MTVPGPCHIWLNRIYGEAYPAARGLCARRRVSEANRRRRLLGRRWPPYHVIANKCAIFFCVHPGLTGNAAPYKWGSVFTCAIGQGFRRGRVTPPYRAFDVCGKAYTFLQNPRDVELTPIW